MHFLFFCSSSFYFFSYSLLFLLLSVSFHFLFCFFSFGFFFPFPFLFFFQICCPFINQLRSPLVNALSNCAIRWSNYWPLPWASHCVFHCSLTAPYTEPSIGQSIVLRTQLPLPISINYVIHFFSCPLPLLPCFFLYVPCCHQSILSYLYHSSFMIHPEPPCCRHLLTHSIIIWHWS